VRTADGRLWELVPDPRVAAVLDSDTVAGREVTVFGIEHPELNAIRVSRVDVQ
jgi:hypothetical protein